MADDLSTINRPKRGEYSDGTNGQAATALPVMAKQDLSTASALPSTNAQGIVQPAGPSATATPAAPTLAAASPLAPVAAPAAAAAAAAPVTPNEPTGPTIIGDPNLRNRPPVGTPGGGASQIPGQTPQQAQQDAAFWAANQNLKPGQEPLISGDTAHTINSVSMALGPQVGMAGRMGVGGINAAWNVLGRATKLENAALAGKSSADIVRNTTSTARGAAQAAEAAAPGIDPTLAAANAATNAAKVAQPQSWWQASSAGQKALATGAVAADVGIPLYQAGAPDQALPAVTGPGAGQNGYPNTMGAPLDATGQPTAFTPPAAAAPGAPGAPAADPNLGQITRVGNSFSGTNVGAGTSPTAEQAAAAHTANMQSYANESAAIADKTARTLAQDEWNGPTPGMVGMDLSRTGGDAYAKFGEDANLRTAQAKGSWSPRKGYQGDETAVKAAMVPVEARQKREAETLKNTNDLAKTKLTTQAENARAAATNAITMRGQNLTADTARGNTLANLYGSDTKAASERAKLEFEAKKSDRDYQHTVEKEGKAMADKEFDIRNKAQDTVTKRIQSMRDPSDKEGAARDVQSVQQFTADTKAKLEEIAKNNPNNKDAQAALDKFKKYGLQSLDDEQIDNLAKGIQLTDKVNAANAKNPNYLMQMWRGTTTGVTSNAPFAGVKKIERPNAPDVYVETDASGRPLGRDGKPLAAGSNEYNRVIPASVVEKDEGILGTGFLAKPNANLRTLTHY